MGAVVGDDPSIEVDMDQALVVYGVLPAADLQRHDGGQDLTGVDGQRVEFVRSGDLAAAVSPVDGDRRLGRRADLLAYQAVLDALAKVGPVAPVRFGSVLPDPDTVVAELMASNEEHLVALLESLRGRRQFNLRVSPVEEAVLSDLVAGDPEIRELRERTRGVPEEASYRERVRLGELVARGLEQRSAQDADMVLDVVVPLAVEHLVRTPPSATQVLDVALLVEESRMGELVDVLEELAESVHERLSLRLLGPLAPYDFVEERPWA
jgi:hypothetical protein